MASLPLMIEENKAGTRSFMSLKTGLPSRTLGPWGISGHKVQHSGDSYSPSLL